MENSGKSPENGSRNTVLVSMISDGNRRLSCWFLPEVAGIGPQNYRPGWCFSLHCESNSLEKFSIDCSHIIFHSVYICMLLFIFCLSFISTMCAFWCICTYSTDENGIKGKEESTASPHQFSIKDAEKVLRCLAFQISTFHLDPPGSL